MHYLVCRWLAGVVTLTCSSAGGAVKAFRVIRTDPVIALRHE
jgi:hypothetical protein